MSKRLKIRIIVVALAAVFAVTAITMPVFLAATKVDLNASTTVNFKVFPPAAEPSCGAKQFGIGMRR